MNHYEILGIARECEFAALKKAYYRRARECHPDRFGNDPGKAEEFKLVVEAFVTLSDISRDALDVASANADRLSLVVALEQKDLLDGFAASSFDLIISNPPYIPAADCACLQPEVNHEPLLALLGGADGCDLYRRIIRTAGPVLKPGGSLLMELGIHESDILVSLLQNEGFTDIQIRQDYAGIDRMILAVHP